MQELATGKTSFVMMPFSETNSCTEQEWTDIFEELYVKNFNELGYDCQRAIPTTGSLAKSIVKQIRYAKIALADLTDQNPNVFYELGIRHSLSKRTIITAQSIEHIPSDLRGYWFIIYDQSLGGAAKFRDALKGIIKEIESDPERGDSPIADFLDNELIAVNSFAHKSNSKRITNLITELSGLINTLSKLTENRNYAHLVKYDCLNELLHTSYIDLGPKFISSLYELRHGIELIKFGIEDASERIHQVRTKTIEVVRHLENIRIKLLEGSYEEPEQHSSMIWSPIGDKEQPHRYSEPVSFENVDFDELEKKFSRD